jgi:hypothetical protein
MEVEQRQQMMSRQPMRQPMAIRSARGSDVKAILLILKEVAGEIPVKLCTSEHVRAIEEQISRCCCGGLSFVALDDDGVVVASSWLKKKWPLTNYVISIWFTQV